MCSFLPLISVNQPWVYSCSLPSEPPPTHPSRLSQSPVSGSLCHTANSLWLSVLHMAVWMFPHCFSIHPTLSFPDCVHMSVFDVCISTAALQIGSSVHLSTFHTRVLISLSCHFLVPPGSSSSRREDPWKQSSLHGGS